MPSDKCWDGIDESRVTSWWSWNRPAIRRYGTI